MKPGATVPMQVRLVVARLQWQLGAPGLAGLLLCLGALGVAFDAWRRPPLPIAAAEAVAAPAASAPAPAHRPRLPAADELPRLLARIEKTAVAEGLGWPQADYRMSEPGSAPLASVEVRCTLKGPYPAVRRFIAALLLENPNLSFKEVSISRVSTDATQVDARLGIVFWLAAPDTGARP